MDETISIENEKIKTKKKLVIEKNRLILSQIFNVVKLFGKLTLPFRGHDECSNSSNKS